MTEYIFWTFYEQETGERRIIVLPDYDKSDKLVMQGVLWERHRAYLNYEDAKAGLDDCICTPRDEIGCKACREYAKRKYGGKIPFMESEL